MCPPPWLLSVASCPGAGWWVWTARACSKWRIRDPGLWSSRQWTNFDHRNSRSRVVAVGERDTVNLDPSCGGTAVGRGPSRSRTDEPHEGRTEDGGRIN